jgi:hypothetical protein
VSLNVALSLPSLRLTIRCRPSVQQNF